MIHTGAARRWMTEQHKKKLRRLYWNAMEYAGFMLWGMAVVMATAMTLFVLCHR